MKKICFILGLVTVFNFVVITAGVGAGPQDLIFVLDNSGSMLKNDPEILTKSMVSAFIKELQEVDRVGLVIFDEAARMAVPLTQLDTPASRRKIFNALDQINYHGQLTNTPAAIERAVYELRNSGRNNSQQSLVFLTDGIIDTGDKRRDADMTKWLIEDLTVECADLGIKIFGVAFTEKADFRLIQSLAARTDGGYYRSLKADDISSEFKKIIAQLNADKKIPPLTVAESMEPVNPVEAEDPIEPAYALKSMETQGDIPDPSVHLGGNVTTVKIKDADEGSLLSTLLLNLLWIIVVIAAIAAVILPVYFFLKWKKERPEKVSPLALEDKDDRNDDSKDDIPNAYPEAQLLGIYENNKDNSKPGLLYLLDKSNITIGRSAKNEIVIPKLTVSNFHAAIRYINGYFQIEDNNSTNGTYLRDKRLPPNKPVQLKHGDIVKFASFDFRFLHTKKSPRGEETMMMTQHLRLKTS